MNISSRSSDGKLLLIFHIPAPSHLLLHTFTRNCWLSSWHFSPPEIVLFFTTCLLSVHPVRARAVLHENSALSVLLTVTPSAWAQVAGSGFSVSIYWINKVCKVIYKNFIAALFITVKTNKMLPIEWYNHQWKWGKSLYVLIMLYIQNITIFTKLRVEHDSVCIVLFCFKRE